MDCINVSESILSSPVPVIIRGVLDWAQLKWTLKDWKANLHKPDKKFPFRKGLFKCSKTPQWERTCQVVNLTIEEFLNQADGKEINQYWYYFDYKHLEQWFNHSISFKDISWSCLGLADVPSSTIWIGSKGAHTPCHYDTYGHNLVAQLYGKKMWLLFPPGSTNELKPCRVPYEESSVYSKINFSCGCADITGISEVRLVILEPGDILYVPKNWWHYVENLTTAISINTWLPKKCDEVSRLEESLAKCVISSFLKDLPQAERDRLLNPNEDDLSGFLNLDELTYCWKHCSDDKNNINCNSESKLPASSLSQALPIELIELKKLLMSKCLEGEKEEAKDDRRIQIDDVINAFCHPEVVTLVRMKLLESLPST